MNNRDTAEFIFEIQGTKGLYPNELEWIQKVRRQLSEYGSGEVKVKMNYEILDNKNTRYIEVFSCDPPVKTEDDALELIALCGENHTNLLMIHYEALSKDFFKLKTGLAGAVLQKFINYSVKVAIIVPNQTRSSSRFKELVSEANQGDQYRFFVSRIEAENWFIKGV